MLLQLQAVVCALGAQVFLTNPPAAVPLEFALQDNVGPDGVKITADNNSMLVAGTPWVGAAGEVHYARLPEDQWGEELMKMKAGGLKAIDTYLFWIHHEEVQGKYDWTGRRNVRKFLETCKTLDIKVMMRVGPWCHGEVRNGGHPDWLIEASKTEHFQLRANDTKYLEYARGWYTEVAAQTKGFYYKDGGPVVFVQNGNENQDSAMLTSLRSIALDVGITPAAFTVTSVNSPPHAFPFLQFVGAYPDRFWTNTMAPTVDTSGYYFKSGGVHEYPPLSVEIGGGMEVAYNHRPLMTSDDLPSYHLCHFASGLNWMGYYMYHGGNNPESASGDAPEAGYQESSFQPAGAANPMPSKTYDFFAAIGEFGQVRGHYHGMRQHGIFSTDYGAHFATTSVSLPVDPPSNGDTKSLRWVARSDGHSGYVFVNNYQRRMPLPPKNDTNFHIVYPDGSGMVFPTFNITVSPGVWFFFPFNMETLQYATATPVCKLGAHGHLFRAVEGIPVELSLYTASISKVLVSNGQVTKGSNTITFTGITPSRSLAVSVELTTGEVVDYVFVSSADGARTWKGSLNGKEYVVLSDQQIDTVMMNDTQVHVRSAEGTPTRLSFFPKPTAVSVGRKTLPQTADGYFFGYQLEFSSVTLPKVKVTKVADAGPAREVPHSPNGKAQEPKEADWAAAQKYTLQLEGNVPAGVDAVMAIRYGGDSARVSMGGELLTDNWYTGYQGDGEMQLGLSYLSGEHPSLLTTQGVLDLAVLPLKKTSVETFVYISNDRWPTFDADGVALTLNEVVVLATYKLALTVN